MALIKTVPRPPSLHRDLCKAVRSPVPVAAALTPFVLPTEAIAILKLETYKFLRGQPCTVKYATRLNCARSTRNQAHVPRRFGVNRLKLPSPGFPDGPVGCPCPHAMEHDPGLAILPVVQPMSQLLIFPGVMTDNSVIRYRRSRSTFNAHG